MNPDFILNIPSNIRIDNIKIYVEPEGWFTKILWRFIRHKSIKCLWTEQVIGEGNTEQFGVLCSNK